MRPVVLEGRVRKLGHGRGKFYERYCVLQSGGRLLYFHTKPTDNLVDELQKRTYVLSKTTTVGDVGFQKGLFVFRLVWAEGEHATVEVAGSTKAAKTVVAEGVGSSSSSTSSSSSVNTSSSSTTVPATGESGGRAETAEAKQQQQQQQKQQNTPPTPQQRQPWHSAIISHHHHDGAGDDFDHHDHDDASSDNPNHATVSISSSSGGGGVEILPTTSRLLFLAAARASRPTNQLFLTTRARISNESYCAASVVCCFVNFFRPLAPGWCTTHFQLLPT
jgi:hypothetical protein